MNAREFLEILHVAEKLKDTPRHCTTRKRRIYLTKMYIIDIIVGLNVGLMSV